MCESERERERERERGREREKERRRERESFLECVWSFLTCCLHGDDKLHVNVFVPSGSDESDCTPGILFVCQSVCVSVPQWEWWPTCYRSHSDHSFSWKEERVCVRACYLMCVFFPMHAVSHHWGWCGGQLIDADLAWLWLSFRSLVPNLRVLTSLGDHQSFTGDCKASLILPYWNCFLYIYNRLIFHSALKM